MPYSGFWRRFIAYLIDALILSIPALLAGGTFRHFGFSIGMNVLLGFFYYPFFDSSALKGTPGKALMGMVVLTEQGERVSFRAAAIRFFMKYISAVILNIGYFMQLFTQKRQTLHDMIAETVVVDRESPDLNYFTVWKDQVKEVFNRL